MNVQSNIVSSTLKSWASAETVCFGDSDAIYDTDSLEWAIIRRNTCVNCKKEESLDICAEIDREWLEKNLCLIIVRNTIYLKCRRCFRLFHLACLDFTVSVYQLRDWSEEDFSCPHC